MLPCSGVFYDGDKRCCALTIVAVAEMGDIEASTIAGWGLEAWQMMERIDEDFNPDYVNGFMAGFDDTYWRISSLAYSMYHGHGNERLAEIGFKDGLTARVVVQEAYGDEFIDYLNSWVPCSARGCK